MTDMERLQQLISESMQHYGALLEFMRTMDTEIGTASYEKLFELDHTLSNLQAQATQTDQVLYQHLDRNPALPAAARSLLENRDRLIEEIFLLNERITGKASGVRSHIAHEMDKLRNGMSAIHGYRQYHSSQGGRIVNSSS